MCSRPAGRTIFSSLLLQCGFNITVSNQISYFVTLYDAQAFSAFSALISFSDQRSLKIENENNSTKVLTSEAPYKEPESKGHFINTKIYPGWLELSLTGTNFHGTKPVRATEFLLYLTLLSHFVDIGCHFLTFCNRFCTDSSFHRKPGA